MCLYSPTSHSPCELHMYISVFVALYPTVSISPHHTLTALLPTLPTPSTYICMMYVSMFATLYTILSTITLPLCAVPMYDVCIGIC